jgi:hypothetical protein
MVSTGNFLRLPGDDRKDYLRIVYHWEVATTKWRSKCPVESGKPPGDILSFFFIIYFLSVLSG